MKLIARLRRARKLFQPFRWWNAYKRACRDEILARTPRQLHHAERRMARMRRKLHLSG